MKVSITLNVPKLKTQEEAQQFVSALCRHIAETFNDDCSIQEFITRIPRKGVDKQ